MKSYTIVACLLLAVVPIQESRAQWRSGNQLAEQGADEASNLSVGACSGYVLGVADLMDQPPWPY